MNASDFYATFLSASPKELASKGYVLQDMVQQYPWFSLAHQLLFKSLCGLGADAYLSQSEKAAAYTFTRSALFWMARERSDTVQEAFDELFTIEAAPQEASQPLQRVVLVGADYFGKSDMEQLSLDVTTPIDRFISEKHHFAQVLQRPGQEDALSGQQDESPALEEDAFVTETLAKIYTDQGYYKLALACYNKLILLYPKKSTYFATLVEKLKNNTNE